VTRSLQSDLVALPEPIRRLSLHIVAAFEQVEPGAELYLVGGIVRDLLLGGAIGHDLDFATSASPRQTQRALKAAGGKVFSIGEKFGTIGAVFEDDVFVASPDAGRHADRRDAVAPARANSDVATDFSPAQQDPGADTPFDGGTGANETRGGDTASAPGGGASANAAHGGDGASAAGGGTTASAAGGGATASAPGGGASANAASCVASADAAGGGASADAAGGGASANAAHGGGASTNAARGDGDGRRVVQVEITTYRAEAYEPGSRKPKVAFRGNLTDDLARRDLTINAIALDPRSGALADPFGGLLDLQQRIIRAVGRPEERFAEDPLRLLRAVRFASRLGFEIEPETASAIRASAHQLQTISRERVRDELEKTLLGPAPARGIELLCDLGLADFSLPDVPKLRGMQQDDTPSVGRHKDVFSHTLQVLDRTPPRLALRWAALLHDIAKPATKRIEHGKVTFHGHDHKGERMARRILSELHEPSELINEVGRLVGLHLRANAYEGAWTDSAVRRFVLDVGEDMLEDLLALSRADVTTGRVERRAAIARSVAELEQRIQELRAQEDIARIASPLDGLDLMQLFDRGPGPWIQPIKDHLRELVIEGELAAGDKEAAIPIARELYAQLRLDEPGSRVRN